MNYTKEFRKGEMLKSQTQVKLYPLQSKVIPESKFSPPLSRPPSKIISLGKLINNYHKNSTNELKKITIASPKKTNDRSVFCSPMKYQVHTLANSRSTNLMRVPKVLSTSNSPSRSNTNKNINSYIQLISFDELLLIEEKIIMLVSSIKNTKPYVINQCIEWWNCFVVSCLFSSSYEYIKDTEVKVLVRSSCSLLMYSIILSYYSVLLKNANRNSYSDQVLDMILYHHRVFLLICEYLILNLTNSLICSQEEMSIISKLSKQIALYIKHNTENKTQLNTMIINDIKVYCNCLSDMISSLLSKYSKISPVSKINFNDLSDLYVNIKQKSHIDLNKFFNETFLRSKTRIVNAITASPSKISIPYMKSPPCKKFTLVLDLDETMIHFHYDLKTDPTLSHGIIQYRPGLFEFLQNVSPYFELVVFTIAMKDYADSVIDSIEKSNTFFDLRLYREHAKIHQNDFVKDLTNLGRDLSKVIIVDDKPFNYTLQKENGIAIRPYWGSDSDTKNDLALVNLIPVLLEIIKSEDVRIGIRKSKNEIVNRVSSNMYQSKMFN